VPYATPSKLLKFANDPTGMVFRLVTALFEGMRPRAWAMYANPHKSTRAKMLPAYTAEDEALNDGGALLDERLDEPPLRLKHHTLLPGFEDWQVIHTPGHSWDSCCYYHRPSGSLITGDTLLGSNKKGRPVKPSVYANPVQLARSVKLLRRLKPQAVYPGHGACFSGTGLLDHLKRGGVKG
jgi:glyoxylase-like metal-dependent hydrolase (beta-lactamase superfamily II)